MTGSWAIIVRRRFATRDGTHHLDDEKKRRRLRRMGYRIVGIFDIDDVGQIGEAL